MPKTGLNALCTYKKEKIFQYHDFERREFDTIVELQVICDNYVFCDVCEKG
jgi:hypothetical protein